MSRASSRPGSRVGGQANGRVILIGGGVRSGKSAFALRLAMQHAGTRAFVATAEARDPEMRARIARHVTERGDRFVTIEAPRELEYAMTRLAKRAEVVVIDCLTLWLSNLMLAGRDPEIEARRLTRFLGVARYPVVFVSNEVGLGLVPDTPLGRRFRDAQGRLNQIMAASVPHVVFIAAGLPLWLKRSSPGES